MVTIPRWRLPVYDHDGHLSQLGMDATDDGQLRCYPPQGAPYAVSLEQLLAAIQQLQAIYFVLSNRTNSALVTQAVERSREQREG